MRSTLAALALLLAAPAAAADAPVLGVLKFQDESGAMALAGGAGRALTTMLTNELAAREGFAVVERQKLYAVLAEQDFAASGRVSPDQGAAIGRLVGADYLVTGTVTALEETQRPPARRTRRSAPDSVEVYIAVDLRVIDVASASIAFARTVEGWAEREDDGGGVADMYAKGDPQVVRAAVIEIIDYLECEMVARDAACRAAYEAKDAARVERTRNVLKDRGGR